MPLESSSKPITPKLPPFAKKILQKANQFKLNESLDAKRKALERQPKSARYIFNRDELDSINAEKKMDSETQLQLLLKESAGLAQPSFQLVGIDCEMVGCGPKGRISKLGRVSAVDYYGNIIYDSFVYQENVTDYRTWISGITEDKLKAAPGFSVVQRQVKELLKGCTVVGHALHFDFKALELNLSDFKTEDIEQTHNWLRAESPSPFSLRRLAFNLLGIKIQTSNHSSVIDALASIAVYRKVLVERQNPFRNISPEISK